MIGMYSVKLGNISDIEYHRALVICNLNFGPATTTTVNWFFTTSSTSLYNGNVMHYNMCLHFDRQDDFVLFSMLYTPE